MQHLSYVLLFDGQGNTSTSRVLALPYLKIGALSLPCGCGTFSSTFCLIQVLEH